MKIAGFDIGGANTDVGIIEFNEENNEIENIITDFKYLPMWYKNNELSSSLLELLGSQKDNIDAIGISMTAELVDAYTTKKEGVIDIATKSQILDKPLAFVSLNGMINMESLKKDPLSVAAANWIATSQIAAEISPNSILLDTGSTTTDIIPIKNGKQCAKGRTDFERLAHGELVYTGTLRTNISSFVDKIEFKDKTYRVSSELFAISADIHNILKNITLDDYTCDTPDGSGKSIKESMLRISRVLCADLDILNPDDVIEISKQMYQKQIDSIAEALKEVAYRENLDTVIVTGLGMDVLAAKAVEKAGLKCIRMGDYFTQEECTVAPAIGTALLMRNYLKK